jgi:prepilin-type N-terminal cleavage/methylation domain-containing protein
MSGSLRRRSLARAARRGFTLVELMVSLVAGVIIAIAVIGLARAATTSFYEQARLTAVEQSVRNAANRLRYDLTKVSFMGTGNIHLATTPNVPYGHRVASQYAVEGNAGTRYTGRSNNLQGIRVLVSGSTTDTQVNTYAGAPNNTSPDAIEIGGNMTTDDWFIGRWVGPTGGTCGGGTFVARSLADPATERLLGDDASANANVKQAFTPTDDTRYFARVLDSLGCQHFVEVEQATAPDATGFTINLCTAAGDSLSLLQPGEARAGCGAIPMTDETLRISPFHRVRWRIGQNIIPALDPPTAIAPANTTFMLFREILNSQGQVVAPLTQIAAEFAVDLKFGIAVDARETTPAPNNILVYDMDSDTTGVGGGGNIDSWTRPASTSVLTTSNPTQPGPQRVRSVKFRVSTRASLPDRNRPLAIISPTSPYISRYCIDMPGCTKFARVRTIVSEVPLINQARMTY